MILLILSQFKNQMFSQTDIISIIGKRGSGKSTLGRAIQKGYPRKIIIDRLGEYPLNDSNIFVDTFYDFSEKIKQTLHDQSFTIVFGFDIESQNHDELFNQVLRIAYYRGNVSVVIEEIHHFASPYMLPQWLRETLLTGRHRGLSLISTTQRPAELHKTILSQSNHIFSGCLYEKNDIDYLKHFMGEDAFKLQNIPIGKFLHFMPGSPSKIVDNGYKSTDNKLT